MAAYVRFVQGAGARVVPIVYDEPEEVTMKKLKSLDGVLFPGGGGDYFKVGRLVLKHAISENDAGKFFPVWGTCLGFERLVVFTATAGDKALTEYGAHHISLPLNFTKNPLETKMYCEMGDDAYKLSSGNFTLNSHSWSVSPETFETDKGLKDFWDVTAVSYDADGKAFVASMEAKKYPIMGTQYHPEKVTQAWNDGYGINHSWESVHLNRIFADQFVAMTRMSKNTFGNYTETQKVLIDNYDKLETDYYCGEVYVFK